MTLIDEKETGEKLGKAISKNLKGITVGMTIDSSGKLVIDENGLKRLREHFEINEEISDVEVAIINTIGPKSVLSDAIGRYFEWCFYKELSEKAFPKNEKIELPASFWLQKSSLIPIFGDDPDGRKRTEEQISNAAEKIAQQFLENNKGKMTVQDVQPIAGNNKAGDLGITVKVGMEDEPQDIILELKYYSSSSLKWWTTTDKIFFKRSLGKYLYENNYWVGQPDYEYKDFKNWILDIREKKFGEFIQGGSDEDRTLFFQALNKGESNPPPKSLILATETSPNRVGMIISIEKMNEILDKKTIFGEQSGVSYQFFRKEDGKNINLGRLTTNRDQLQGYAKRSPDWHPGTGDEENDFRSAEILFYLQKGYYDPPEQGSNIVIER